MTRPADTDSTFEDMALLTRGYQLARMIHVAVSLGLADHLASGPLPAAGLASAAGAHPAMLLRLCRALAAFGIFAVDEQGQVSHTPRSQHLRQDAAPTLYHAARYWATPQMWDAWGHLGHTLRTGESAFESVFGVPKFEYLKRHPQEAELFDLFMQHSPSDRHTAVAAAYDFSGVGLLVDVGGGNGALLAAILRVNPDVRGLLFDQAAVVAGAGHTLAPFAGRWQTEAGSFFERVPSGGEVYLLSQVLHDWDDGQALRVLHNVRAAIPAGRRLLVIERLLEQGSAQANPEHFLADINMMVSLHGRERTPDEYAELFAQTGFTAPRIVRTRSPFCILETLSC
jgi:O-methyltransferase domain